MKLGVRSKLFFVSLLLITFSVGAAGFVLIRDLRAELERRIERELERNARGVATALDRHVGARTVRTIDPLADDFGETSGMRVTIVSPEGVVLGDSEVNEAELATLENHAARPEIKRARAAGTGSARRYSKTLTTEMLYVAVATDDGWTIRAARPLLEVEESVARLRRRLIVAALVGLFIAIVLSALASHWMTRVIRELASRARTVAAGGDRTAITIPPPSDELSNLAGSIDLLADQIEGTVSELARERAQFATVLESMDEGVIALDDAQTITLINPTALRLLGLAHSPLGRPLSDAVRAPALVDLASDVPGVGSKAVEFELGRARRLLARATQPASGVGSVIVLHDVTEVHRLEAVRRDFVANVSHELRTPVSIISANAEALLDTSPPADPAAAKLLEAVHRNSIRMGRLVADLLDLSRLEAGRYEMESEALELESLARAVVATVVPRAEESATTVTVEIEPGLAVLADRAALDQVLVNLLENAIKYTPRGGVVLLRGMKRGDAVRLEVEDNGPGVPPQLRDRIFERFYRLDPGRSRETGGTGLGLSIVRHLVSGMAGTVGVEAGTPGGAVFWVELPAA